MTSSDGRRGRDGDREAPRSASTRAALADAPEVQPAPVQPAGGSGPPRGPRLRTFQSLENRDFRWYLVAMTGHWSAMQMQQLVRLVLVFQITGSYAALGLIGLVNALPRLFLALFGGVVADRASKRHVIQVSGLLSMGAALAVAVLLVLGMLEFWHLLFAAGFQGTVNALTMPSRQSMIPEIVGMERLTNAIALNAVTQNTMRLMAPAVGGVLLSWVGASTVYFLMAALYLAAVLSLLKVPAKEVPARRRDRRGGNLADIAEGIRYIGRNGALRMILAVHFLVVVCSMPYQRMLPGFVMDVLQGEEWVVGMLMALTGVGALAGSLVIASLADGNRGRIMLIASVILGAGIFAFSFTTAIWASALIVIVVGVGQSARQSISNALVQSNVTDEFRGRVMSVYMMEMGLVSLGAFGVGLIANEIGIQYALAGAATLMLVFVLGIYLFMPKYRHLE